jgi:DNA-binding Lrp family transcriptional regulator
MAKKDIRIKGPSYALDEHDRRLLAALQVSTRRTLEDLSRLVALSPSSVRRRLERLRRNGAIRAEIALLDPAVLEQGIRVLTLVNFAREGASVYREFRRRIASEPRVLQCFSISGQYDFALLCAARDPADYEKWGERVLLSNPSIGRYDSFVVWSTVKELAQPMLRQP